MRKIWLQLRRECFDVARCTAARLTKIMYTHDIILEKPHKTTFPDKDLLCPLDRVNRQYRRPAQNILWLSISHTGPLKGFIYVEFVIDAKARKVVGWRVSTSRHAGFVLYIPERAVHERCLGKAMGLIFHNARSNQNLSIKYTKRLAEAGIEDSVGRVADSYDNAFSESTNCLFEAEVIHRRSFEAVEYATLEGLDCFNNRCLLEHFRNIPIADA